ncbi:MAG: CRISPR-associated endonuclease Cas2 [Candidatus Competibacteraceae bacterium]
MPARQLYIAAYDVTDDARLRHALQVLKGYASGGQKSVFECFLTAGERQMLLAEIRAVLDLQEDRFMLLPLATSSVAIQTLGIAIAPSDPDFYYVG